MTGLWRRIRVGPIGPSPSGVTRLPAARAGRLQIRARAEHAALPVEHRDRGLLILIKGPERVGEGGRGGAVDGVAPLGPREQHRVHGAVALDADRGAHDDAAPTARRTNRRNAPTTSSRAGLRPATGESGPTSASPHPPTSAAATSSAF